jgi:glucosylceramidase
MCRCPPTASSFPSCRADAAYSTIEVIQTARDTGDRLTRKPDLSFGNDFPAPLTVTFNPQVTYQQILGFGGALTEAATFTLSQMNDSLVQEVLNAYYSAEGHAYTIGRVPMNSCDFSVQSYCFDWVAGDWDLTHFDMNVTHDTQTMIPFILRAQQMVATSQPGQSLRLFTTPWSPPNWMKSNDNMNGSNVPGLILGRSILCSPCRAVHHA